jgi:hypothetical protein
VLVSSKDLAPNVIKLDGQLPKPSRMMNPEESKLQYERVFIVTDYYDGPRKGIANFSGEPHFYECIFDEAKGDYADLFSIDTYRR